MEKGGRALSNTCNNSGGDFVGGEYFPLRNSWACKQPRSWEEQLHLGQKPACLEKYRSFCFQWHCSLFLFLCTRIAPGSLSNKPHTNPVGSLEDTPGLLFTPTPTCLVVFLNFPGGYTSSEYYWVRVACSQLPFSAWHPSAFVLACRCTRSSVLVKMSQ